MHNATRNALVREAAIAAEHLGSGATIIGKANYAHHAHYGQAFFSISTGIERGAKLALAVNHALNSGGSFPPPRELRAYGHNLEELLYAMDNLASDLGLELDKRLPNSDINKGIVKVLTEFASNITRYYNLDFVMGNVHSNALGDPIESWYRLVTTPILEKHLSKKQKENIETNARQVSERVESISFVSFTSETGSPLHTAYAASIQTGLNEFANPYARMYVLQFARFYARIMSELSYQAHLRQFEFIPNLSEFFALFNNEDSYLRRRKTWSIYKP